MSESPENPASGQAAEPTSSGPLDPVVDDAGELRELALRVRERLGHYARAGAEGVPRPRAPRFVEPAPPLRPSTQPATSAAPPRQPAPFQPAPFQPAPFQPPPFQPPPFQPPPSRPQLRGAEGLRVIREVLGDCQRCGLGRARTNIVYGVGNPEAPLVFVGEGPGENEDLSGEPFVGKAGELLTRMIGAMGFARSDIYICNVVKCRPPGNRNPLPDEIAACEPFLVDQLGAIAPKVIVALGKFAAQTLLRTDTSISALRGRFQRYQGIALMPTFHPAFMLRNPASRKEVWEDLKLVIAELDRLGVPHGPVGLKQG